MDNPTSRAKVETSISTFCIIFKESPKDIQDISEGSELEGFGSKWTFLGSKNAIVYFLLHFLNFF